MVDNHSIIKICLLIPIYCPVPAVRGGAVETLVTNLLENIKNVEDRKIQLTVCSIYDTEAEHIVKEKGYKNVNFFWTHPEKMRYKISNFLFRAIRKIFKVKIVSWMAHYGEIASLIQRERFDLLIAEGGDYRGILDISTGYERSQMVLHLHCHDLPNSTIASGYGIVIGVSDFVLKEYIRHCKAIPRTYVLKNCIDLMKFDRWVTEEEKKQLRQKLNFSQEDFVVLYVGRIIEVKGILELIEGLISIPDETVKLLIIGSPNFAQKAMTPYLKKVMSLAEIYSDRISFTGYIPNDDLYKYYKIADIQCVPSTWEEAAGLVVLEGMAAGVPIIATHSGGMIEYITEETALIIERHNLVENLSNAIIKLKQDESRRKKMSAAARKYVCRYNTEDYYQNFVKIIMDIVKEQKSESRDFDIS